MSEGEKPNEKNRSFINISVIVTLFIIGLWLLTGYLLIDEEERGSIGDMFGSVNAIFSGLALAGIILTILLQRKELGLQRDALKATREEFKTQNETLKIQRFENTFFNLLNQHHRIVNSIDFRYYKKKEKEHQIVERSPFDLTHVIMQRTFISSEPPPPAEEKEVVLISGREVFRFRYNQMVYDISNSRRNFQKVYLEHYKIAQTDFGHYFRNLYRMIKLVDQTDFFYDSSKVTEKEVYEIKYNYISIIRAQISDYELLWLFYNCLSINGIEKFKPYIEKYSFFKNLPKELLARSSHFELYDGKAYNPDYTT